MPRFKADLHIHNCDDFLERSVGLHGLLSPYECIDIAHRNGYRVLSFTHHGIMYEDRKVTRYAQEKGILLIPGVEAFVDDKHVLLYNFPFSEPVDTFEKLIRYKNKDNLVIAPHAFYPAKCCLQNDLIKYIEYFDALEYSHFYTRHFNPNKKVVKVSEQYKKPIVGFSDTHYYRQFGTIYSLIDADEFSIQSIIKAIKQGHVEVVTQPLSYFQFMRISLWMFLRSKNVYKKFIRKNLLSIEPSCHPEK